MDAMLPATVDVSATYGSAAAARRAIEALQYAGIDPSQIRLLGAAVDAARAADARPNASGRDLPMVWRVFWRGLLWSVIGTPAGALVGLALGLAGFVAINLWITIALWALFGHLLGGIWGAYAALSIGDAWEMTFQDAEAAPVIVSVRIEGSSGQLGRVEQLLRDGGPSAVAVRPAGAAQ
ncbi:MAG: hypothetical protein IVW36_10460 [Dehalococcoidia bacterium]|nr:hypothetical protein [Dehalococcoidia bacterium]